MLWAKVASALEGLSWAIVLIYVKVGGSATRGWDSCQILEQGHQICGIQIRSSLIPYISSLQSVIRCKYWENHSVGNTTCQWCVVVA